MADYRELQVWQKSRKLAVHMYKKTADFPDSEKFGLVQQMRRCAISVASNIAEAHGRTTSRERIRFLSIARGSLHELEMQTLISGDLALLTKRQTTIIVDATNELARQINGLIRHYKQRDPGRRQPTTGN
jgi:four helix bundle protein